MQQGQDVGGVLEAGPEPTLQDCRRGELRLGDHQLDGLTPLVRNSAVVIDVVAAQLRTAQSTGDALALAGVSSTWSAF